MNRPRIWLEILLLVLVIGLATAVWLSRSKRGSDQTSSQTNDAPETSKLSGFLQERKPDPKPTSLPSSRTERPTLPVSASLPGLGDSTPSTFEPESPVVCVLTVKVPGQASGQQVQLFSTDCGFSLEVVNNAVTLELPPGTCNLQLQTTDGAVLVRTDAVEVTLPAGDNLEVTLELPEPSLADPGILLSPENNYAVINSVIPGSPAAQMGLRVGDIVIEIDGIPVEGLSVADLDRLLVGPANSQIQFTLVVSDAAGNFEEAVVETQRIRIN